MEQTQANTGLAPQMTLADAGYAAEATFLALEARRLPASIALGREDKKQRQIDPERHPATGRMAQWLKTAQGKEHYRRRKTIPEPVFGWIKQAFGFRRFSMRGLEAAKAEWNLICMAMNLRRMRALGWSAA